MRLAPLDAGDDERAELESWVRSRTIDHRRRLHSALGYMTPTACENKIRNHDTVHAT